MKGNLCRCTGYRSIKQAITAGRLNQRDTASRRMRDRLRDRDLGCIGEPDTASSSRPIVNPPAAKRVVTGTEPYTFDIGRPRRARPAGARLPARRTPGSARSTPATAERVDGVAAGPHPPKTFPAQRFSTARHENRLDDPDDTRMLDDVVRFVGQRVAAVVADTADAAEEACRRIRVEYEVLPAVFDPEEARRTRRTAAAPRPLPRTIGLPRPAATTIADHPRRHRRRRRSRRWRLRDVTVSGSWQTQRVSHAPTRDPRHHRLDRRRRPTGAAHQLPGAIPGARRAVPAAGPAARSGCGSSPSGSAAASAANRRSSPRTWSHWRCCAPVGRSATR